MPSPIAVSGSNKPKGLKDNTHLVVRRGVDGLTGTEGLPVEGLLAMDESLALRENILSRLIMPLRCGFCP